ncbi:Vi polysaccharide biosynthesis UDP-N-acetylglucosamine C-6 dehydrogenase TviB [Desulfogranum mediterraneum]|uniref:Vi polysaccharide biosynthesis UDP-N-acetylglucosamine C-6 dehydrogenase TviB n=1 Tax=Desulfogranum mediterraneum TaxID=160661 RepID=UPI0004233DDD|nr:Vi polysaccharide biosynthesis UDP-N-acetylglucosamine C-6 dehydrogenase TviB [Desulfogranum mediterraneum]
MAQPAPPSLETSSIGIIGLGYVGLPLAVAFSGRFPTTGFDLNQKRITQLEEHLDTTQEVSSEELQQAGELSFTSRVADLTACNVYIVAVPTPIDDNKNPDLSPLIGASQTVAQVLKPGDVVIYESTVYPGATEEVCIPILEQESGLVYNQDFFAGYSPERINPGDHEHRLPTIMKVTSGSTPQTADFVDALYGAIITAGTFKASSIPVAEAAKVIENTQRDVNIALINELALIFNRLGIDTLEVLEAAGTKWNFLPFRPGLVGGHCIGVDPYYLTHKAQEVGYHPEMILAGRRLNDHMGSYIAAEMVKLMLKKRIHVADARILVLGLTFKENCPDLRNTRVVDIIAELENYGARVDVHDPWTDPEEAGQRYGISMIEKLPQAHYDGVLLAVAHAQFAAMSADRLRQLCKERAVIYDVKHVLPREVVDGSL